ncbi:transcription factor AP-4-like [Conger conger]|uniref:transcription factor AP-4-like n=1 Tax=Conger conger TaxID=82655 RepID=UPI002A5AE6D4|nr:transcription factor AP-4-like [Conger conger]
MRISSFGKHRNIARRKGGLQGDDKVIKKDWISQTGEKSMEYFMMPAQKVPLQHFRKTEKDVIGGLCSLANIPLTPETARDQERRIRREIANSNERRRMQSINAGFQSLKTLIPHSDGEKLSKAAILQQTADYIYALEQEKTRLLQQNNQLKRFIQEFTGSSPKRRRVEEKDEGIGSPDVLEEEKAEEVRREMIELRQQLDKERSVRLVLEEQVRSLDSHLFPEKLQMLAQQLHDEQEQTETLLRLQHLHKHKQKEQKAHSPQLPAPATPPAPTHHATVIVPAPTLPLPPHHITVVTMSPASVINTVSTSRQNLDTIVQAIQHIEGTQEKSSSVEEDQRRAVIVASSCASSRPPLNTADSDTASDSEGPDEP